MLTGSSGPNQALLERISFLESQLAAYANTTPPETRDGEKQQLQSPASSEERLTNSIADIVGFLSLGGEAAYVGASSGFALATNLGQMVQGAFSFAFFFCNTLCFSRQAFPDSLELSISPSFFALKTYIHNTQR